MADLTPPSERYVRMISESFEIDPEDIRTDARVALTWTLPTHDLIAWLSARHRFSTEAAASYLNTLYQAVRDSD